MAREGDKYIWMDGWGLGSAEGRLSGGAGVDRGELGGLGRLRLNFSSTRCGEDEKRG